MTGRRAAECPRRRGRTHHIAGLAARLAVAGQELNVLLQPDVAVLDTALQLLRAQRRRHEVFLLRRSCHMQHHKLHSTRARGPTQQGSEERRWDGARRGTLARTAVWKGGLEDDSRRSAWPRALPALPATWTETTGLVDFLWLWSEPDAPSRRTRGGQ